MVAPGRTPGDRLAGAVAPGKLGAMTTLLAPKTPARARSRLRPRIARLERPLLAAGLALVALHLLDLTFSGSHTTVLGVLAIVAAPLAWFAAQPRVTRPTRVALGVVVGLLAIGFGVVSHGLHAVNSGLDRYDLTGIGMIAGGLLLVAAGLAAVAAPRRAPRRRAAGWRLAHGGGWLVGAFVAFSTLLMPLRGGPHGHARPALGDPGVLARRPARGGPDRCLRRPHAVGLVRPLAQRRRRASRPRLRRQPRARAGGDPPAREARLRRARLRPVRQRREQRPLERARRQRPAGRRRRARLRGSAPRRRPGADRRLRLVARRRGAARGGRPRAAHRAVVSDGAARPEDQVGGQRPGAASGPPAGSRMHAARIIGGERRRRR